MAEQFYKSPRTFPIGNRTIAVTVDRLSHRDKSDLRNYFQDYALDPDLGMVEGLSLPAGGIEQLVMRRSLKKLEVGTTTIQFTSANPIDDFPDIGMGDDDGDVELDKEVIKTIVDKNRWLGRTSPFNMVFAQYLALVNADKQEYEEKVKEKAEAEGKRVPEQDDVPKDGVGDNPLE